MPDHEEKKPPLKVTDRRSFTPEGERRSPSTPEETARQSPPPPPGPAVDPQPAVKGDSFEMRPAPEPPPSGGMQAVDFSSFVLSLTSTAFIHLGDMEDPVTRTRSVHLPAARQMIDIIDMLRAKTKGNLEPQEAEFIDQVLYELKMRYAEKASSVR
jgi:hypothetical protein